MGYICVDDADEKAGPRGAASQATGAVPEAAPTRRKRQRRATAHWPRPLPRPRPPRPRPPWSPLDWPPLAPRKDPCWLFCDSLTWSMTWSGTRRYLICATSAAAPRRCAERAARGGGGGARRTYVVALDVGLFQLHELVAFLRRGKGSAPVVSPRGSGWGEGAHRARLHHLLEGEVHPVVAHDEVTVERLSVLELDQHRLALGGVKQAEGQLRGLDKVSGGRRARRIAERVRGTAYHGQVGGGGGGGGGVAARRQRRPSRER